MSWIALSCWILSVGLITFLLLKGLLKSTAYTALFISICAFALALLGFERLTTIDIQGGKLTLEKVNEAKAEVFAKADTVNRLAEASAKLAAASVHLARPLSFDEMGQQMSEEGMLRLRDEIVSILKEAGNRPSVVDQTKSDIDATVLETLKKKLYWQILNSPVVTKEISDRIHEIIFDTYSREALIDYLRSKNIPSEKLTPQLDRIDLFLKSGHL
jgi:hypothetical protein